MARILKKKAITVRVKIRTLHLQETSRLPRAQSLLEEYSLAHPNHINSWTFCQTHLRALMIQKTNLQVTKWERGG